LAALLADPAERARIRRETIAGMIHRWSEDNRTVLTCCCNVTMNASEGSTEASGRKSTSRWEQQPNIRRHRWNMIRPAKIIGEMAG